MDIERNNDYRTLKIAAFICMVIGFVQIANSINIVIHFSRITVSITTLAASAGIESTFCGCLLIEAAWILDILRTTLILRDLTEEM